MNQKVSISLPSNLIRGVAFGLILSAGGALAQQNAMRRFLDGLRAATYIEVRL